MTATLQTQTSKKVNKKECITEQDILSQKECIKKAFPLNDRESQLVIRHLWSNNYRINFFSKEGMILRSYFLQLKDIGANTYEIKNLGS